MFGPEWIALVMVQASWADAAIVRRAQENMTPEHFKEWQDERKEERRHHELCSSIEQAGTNARPRGLGILQ